MHPSWSLIVSSPDDSDDACCIRSFPARPGARFSSTCALFHMTATSFHAIFFSHSLHANQGTLPTGFQKHPTWIWHNLWSCMCMPRLYFHAQNASTCSLEFWFRVGFVASGLFLSRSSGFLVSVSSCSRVVELFLYSCFVICFLVSSSNKDYSKSFAVPLKKMLLHAWW